jgi:hypothetical protein
MSDWISIMNGLQAVKRAEEDFLLRDFVEEQIIGPYLLDRIAEDLSRIKLTNSLRGVQPRSRTADDNEQ